MIGMVIIEQKGDCVKAELWDTLQDRANTVQDELTQFVQNSQLSNDRTRDEAGILVFELCDKYAPPDTAETEIEDLYFLHYRAADKAYTDLDFGDGREVDYMRASIIALLVKQGLEHLDKILPPEQQPVIGSGEGLDEDEEEPADDDEEDQDPIVDNR